MMSSDDKALPQHWLRGIEGIARCAWLLALLLVAGTALSRAHAEDHLLRVHGAVRASNSAGNTNVDVWDGVETAAPGRVSLSEGPASTLLQPVLEEEQKDVGGLDESEAEATPEALTSASWKPSAARSLPTFGAAPLRTVVRGLYAARAPPRLA